MLSDVVFRYGAFFKNPIYWQRPMLDSILLCATTRIDDDIGVITNYWPGYGASNRDTWSSGQYWRSLLGLRMCVPY